MAEEVDALDLAELQAFLAGGATGTNGGGNGYDAPDVAPPPGIDQGGLVGEAKAKVTVQSDDPTATYLAASSWDELNIPKEILDGIYELGFVKPSKIQEWALPIALKGGSIIGQAQNGSGKTASFALAMLIAVDTSYQVPQCMCVCPTRELATQNMDVCANLGKHTSIGYYLAVPQADRAPKKVDAQIVVGTPGKLQDLMKKRVINSKWVKCFVLDEADVMIDEKNQMGSQVIQIRNWLEQDLQILLFSATWPPLVEEFAKKLVPHGYTIKVQKEDLTLETITQTYIDVGEDSWPWKKKTAQLSDLYGALNIGQSIIFVNRRDMAFELAKTMKSEGHAVSLICGTQTTGEERIDPAYRDKIMHEFRIGVTKVLIATDVLARGIDVPAVTMVVNFELPMSFNRRDPECEVYLHRIGRTGRFGLKGVAVNLVTSAELRTLESIKKYYRCDIQQLSGDVEEIETIVKNIR